MKRQREVTIVGEDPMHVRGSVGRRPLRALVSVVGALLLVVTITTSPVLIQGAAEGDQPGVPVVDEAVYQALASNAGGRAYVMILLMDPVANEGVGLEERMLSVQSRQQAVLDTFDQDEFDLVHRPRTVARLTGRVDAAGVVKLATNSLVRNVGLDVMNCGISDECPDGTDVEALEGTSWFVLTSLFAPPAKDGAPAPCEERTRQAKAIRHSELVIL